MAYRANILINSDAPGAEAVYGAFLDELQELALRDEVQVLMTSGLGGQGVATQGVEAIVYPDSVRYVNLTPDEVARITEEHLLKGRPVLALTQAAPKVAPLPPPAPKEVRVVLRNVGKINPFDIEDYIAEDGYAALAKVLTTMTPEQVLDVMVRQLGHRMVDAKRLISEALKRNSAIATPEALFEEVYRGEQAVPGDSGA